MFHMSQEILSVKHCIYFSNFKTPTVKFWKTFVCLCKNAFLLNFHYFKLIKLQWHITFTRKKEMTAWMSHFSMRHEINSNYFCLPWKTVSSEYWSNVEMSIVRPSQVQIRPRCLLYGLIGLPSKKFSFNLD